MRLRMQKNSAEHRVPRTARETNRDGGVLIAERGARNAARQNGFLLVEALAAIVILSIAAATFLAGMAQALHVQNKTNETTRAILQFEKELYGLETGKRLDLILYGGREPRDSYQLAVESQEKIDSSGKLPSFYHLKMKLSWKDAKEFLEENLFAGA